MGQWSKLLLAVARPLSGAIHVNLFTHNRHVIILNSSFHIFLGIYFILDFCWVACIHLDSPLAYMCIFFFFFFFYFKFIEGIFNLHCFLCKIYSKEIIIYLLNVATTLYLKHLILPIQFLYYNNIISMEIM